MCCCITENKLNVRLNISSYQTRGNSAKHEDIIQSPIVPFKKKRDDKENTRPSFSLSSPTSFLLSVFRGFITLNPIMCFCGCVPNEFRVFAPPPCYRESCSRAAGCRRCALPSCLHRDPQRWIEWCFCLVQVFFLENTFCFYL